MADIGTSIGDHHYINLDFMGTAERWTFPRSGYSQILQVGEENADHQPFVDAQHPHSSPVMGLTLSDTIAFGRGSDHVKISFAPRGEATEGPVAFMHRPTGMVNPDVPLGHHIGQDVGHISGTVVAASFRLWNTTFEASTFNGQEPNPMAVDLPMRSPDSYAMRLIQQLTPYAFVMASLGYVKNPEAELDHIQRYSISLFGDRKFSDGWRIANALMWGLVNGYDRASALNSLNDELLFQRHADSFWGRFEMLQRTPDELLIAGIDEPEHGRWVTVITLGYTREFTSSNEFHLGVGGSFTKNFLPPDFHSGYAGDPVLARLFVQVSGLSMWNL